MNTRLLFLTAFTLLLMSCGGSKKTTSRSKRDIQSKNLRNRLASEESIKSIDELPNPVKEDVPHFKSDISKYIYQYRPVAKEEMATYGIPASITLAQGLLESKAGTSNLTRRSNNHFGIKCHGWSGAKVYHDDDRRQECFRKYKNPNYSFRDHSLFLKDRSRYSALFRLAPDDYEGWARGLKSAGYATDPAYPKKLINLIERYELYKYDRQVLDGLDDRRESHNDKKIADQQRNKPEKPSIHKKYYTVKKGDTLYSISKRFGLSVENLKKQNDISDNTISIGQKLDVSDS